MFSQELMDIFRIDNSVADLDEKVDKRSVALARRCAINPSPPNPVANPTLTPPAEQRKQKC